MSDWLPFFEPKTHQMRHINVLLLLIALGFLIVSTIQCKTEDDLNPPVIRLIMEPGCVHDGDTLEIGKAIRFRVEVIGTDISITNFSVKKVFNGTIKTVLDSGMNSRGFVKDFTFYQGVEECVEWRLSVMDRNRKEASVSIILFKDPDSQFGGILEFQDIVLGYQDNDVIGHFFLPDLKKVMFGDSAAMFQDKVDMLAYFNYSADNGNLLPSPTFSSPGEEISCSGDLYSVYYPFLCNWNIRNYTKYDIRAVNGVTKELFHNAHNDSLLIVSYDDVWGKKKYKWAYDGIFIPFLTAAGKKGIIHVIKADTIQSGQIRFSVKMQI
jgi:hypothetical protein